MNVPYTVNGGKNLREFRQKSTKPKPIEGVKDMETLWEPDTNKVFWFDGDTKTWVEAT